MLTDKEVKHIAGLARIKINEKEEKGLKKDLSSFFEVSSCTTLSQTRGRKYSGCMDTGFGSGKHMVVHIFTCCQEYLTTTYCNKKTIP